MTILAINPDTGATIRMTSKTEAMTYQAEGWNLLICSAARA